MAKLTVEQLNSLGLKPETLPRHVAIVMDGNGRWAQKRGLPRSFGHRAGTERLREIIRFSSDAGIQALTLYAFSTENWRRPEEGENDKTKRRNTMKRKLMLVLLAALLAVGMVGVSAPAARADDTVYTEGTLYYTLGDGTITIVGCFGKNEEIHVPAMIAGIPVNTIASGAFAENQYVKKVYLPDTISKVGRLRSGRAMTKHISMC